MSEKVLNSRIVHKHDVEANWLKAVNFTPKQGEIIVYDIDDTYDYERFKIGDGKMLVSALPFADDAVKDIIGEVDTRIDNVSALVGDVAVSEQINTALSNKADSNHVHDVVTISTNGFMSTDDKKKLNSIADGANNYEAYLEWGGKSLAGEISPVDAALVPYLGANRFAFMPADSITIEYSTNGGSTWEAYETSDANKIQLFNGNGDAYIIGASQEIGIDKSQYMLRMTIDTDIAGIYAILNKFVIYCATQGSTGSYCVITGRTHANYASGTDTWATLSEQTPIAGWSGYSVVNTNPFSTYNGSGDSYYQQIRFTFGVESHASTVGYAGLAINKVLGYGKMGWQAPSTMARTGDIYTYDYAQNVTFPAKVTATSFVGNATSATQDASGNVITNTYATKAELNDVSSLVGDTAVATQISNAIQGSAMAPTQLTGGDLNNIRTPGYYFAGGSSGVTNIPTGVDAFGVEVYRSAGGYITQELTSGNKLTGKKFVRTYNNSTWSGWEVIYTSAYPQVHVGPTEPTDPNVQVWINTSEEDTGVVPVLPRITTINLPAANWTGSSAPYSQTVSVNTVTSATKIDLQPTVAQITSLQNDDIALMAENTNGTVKIYAFGGKPSADMTMQVLLTEVSYV